MSSRKGDREKARYWQRIIREAARSGMSIREFYRQRRLKESQYYWWQHKLKVGRQELSVRGQGVKGEAASFALVSDEPETTDTGKRLDIDPFAYLHNIFDRISTHPQNRLAKLLPGQWKAARRAASTS